MRILFAIKSLNVRGGGAERVLVEVAGGLYRKGHEVKVLTFDFPGESFYSIPPGISRLDMAFNPAGESMPRMAMLRALPRMRAAISVERPDIVVAFMHSTYVPVAISMLGLGVPLVVSEHIDAHHYSSRPLQRYLRALIDRLAVVRTVPSHAVKVEYQRLTGSSPVVVPNPIADHLRHLQVNALPASPPLALAVGRLMEQKDHAVLIDSFCKVAAEYPAWRLKIVGDGPLREQLQAQVVRLGLQHRVELAGFTRDVAEEYRKARFLVLSSRYESFGMVAAEALAAGRAVLSFDDCLGLRDFVKSESNGLLVRGANDRVTRVANLAAGLRQLMGSPEKCAVWGRAGPPSVASFSLEAVVHRWEELLSQAVFNGAKVRH